MQKQGRRTQLTNEIASAVRDLILQHELEMTQVQIQKALEGSTSAYSALQKTGELVGVFPKGDDGAALFLSLWKDSVKGALEFMAERAPIPIDVPFQILAPVEKDES